MLILSRYIAQHEFKPLRRFLGLDDILEGAQKVFKGLGVRIKSPREMERIHFFKVRIGKKNNARMIVFMTLENQKIIPVLIRLKKDKSLGMNMAVNNPKVINQLNKNLNHILDDIQKKQFEEF